MKRKMSYRLLCLFLALLTLAALPACKSKKPSDTDTSTDPVTDGSKAQETNEAGEIIIDNPVFDGLDYEGETIHITRPETDLFRREFALSINERQDEVDNRVFLRDVAVQKKLNVDFRYHQSNVLLQIGSGTDFIAMVNNAAQAGGGELDIFTPSSGYIGYAAVRNVILNLRDTKYFDSEHACWNQNHVSVATVQGQLYAATGDLTISLFDKTLVTLTNITKLEAMGVNDIYDTVLNGNWTLDRMEELIRDYHYEDLDANGVKSLGDSFALTGMLTSELIYAWPIASDITVMKTREDGFHYVDTNVLEPLDTLRERIDTLINSESCLAYNNGEDVNGPYNQFTEGKALFTVDSIIRNRATSARLRNMTDRFAILPIPKGSTEQTAYATTPELHFSVVAMIKTTTERQNMVSAAVQLLGEESYKSVRPYYIETVLKNRYTASSAKAVRILSDILDSVRFEFSILYADSVGNAFHSLWVWRLQWRDISTIAGWETDKKNIEDKTAVLDDWFASHMK